MEKLQRAINAFITLDKVYYKGIDISKLMYKKTDSFCIYFKDIPYYFDKSKVIIIQETVDSDLDIDITDAKNGLFTINTDQPYGTLHLSID